MKARLPKTKHNTSMTELIAAIRASDQQAFAELYKMTSQEIYRTVRTMIRDEDTVRDVQQDTYVFAYSHLDQLSDPEKVCSWLRAIAVNRARNILRRQTPILFTEMENEDGEGIPEQADLSLEASPELSLEQKETARLVNGILANLSDGQRAAVAMYYYEQMSVAEIAKALDVAHGTVKSQLARGKKKIEEAVRALEKEGVKLYGLSPLPFLLALLKRQSLPVQEGETILTKTLAKAGITAAAKTAATPAAKAAAAPVAETVAVHVGRSFFETAVGKLVLSVICIGVIGGGVAGFRWFSRHMSQIQDTTLPTESEQLLVIPIAPTAPTESGSVPSETGPSEAVPTNSGTAEPTEFDSDSERYSGLCGEHLTWRFDPETGTLTIEGSGPMEDYVEESLGWGPLWSTPWSRNYYQVTSISLPEGLTKIGNNAFAGTNLTEIIIPASVASIGDLAFFNCYSLSSVTIPDSVTSIGYAAFGYCDSLTSVTIPDSVISIGNEAFTGCAFLASVTIGSGVTSIGDYVFNGCARLTSVTIPDSVTNFAGNTLGRCVSLESIDVASDNPYFTSVDGVLFSKDQKKLIAFPQEKIAPSYTVPAGVVEIGEGAFSDCLSLHTVTIPDSVTSIGDEAFASCSNLGRMTIGKGVETIGDGAFYRCTALTSITIPDSVEEIGDGAFKDCESLSSIEAAFDNPYFTSVDGVLFSKDQKKLVAFPLGRNAASYAIPASVVEIDAGAFYECTSLTSVTIPNSVTSIGKEAFWGCGSLTSATIPNSVTSIGDGAFECCCSLTSVTIPDSVIYLGDAAFAGCDLLTSVTIGKGVTSIGDSAFVSTALTDVTIPSSVTSIGDSAFLCCSALTSVTIPNSVTSIGKEAFGGCGSLSSVAIPDSVTGIGSWAFYECTALTSVTIPDGVTSIGDFAFAGCSSLTSMKIGSGVKNIGMAAFSQCSLTSIDIVPDNPYLTSVDGVLFSKNLTRLIEYLPGKPDKFYEIPLGVTEICVEAFCGCDSLTSVTIPDSVTSIGDYAFDGCGSLSSVAIPDSVTGIGSRAFYECTALTSVTIPDSVTVIGSHAFGYFGGADYGKVKGFTICCAAGSAAQTYAVENGFQFIAQ